METTRYLDGKHKRLFIKEQNPLWFLKIQTDRFCNVRGASKTFSILMLINRCCQLQNSLFTKKAAEPVKNDLVNPARKISCKFTNPSV